MASEVTSLLQLTLNTFVNNQIGIDLAWCVGTDFEVARPGGIPGMCCGVD